MHRDAKGQSGQLDARYTVPLLHNSLYFGLSHREAFASGMPESPLLEAARINQARNRPLPPIVTSFPSKETSFPRLGITFPLASTTFSRYGISFPHAKTLFPLMGIKLHVELKECVGVRAKRVAAIHKWREQRNIPAIETDVHSQRSHLPALRDLSATEF